MTKSHYIFNGICAHGDSGIEPNLRHDASEPIEKIMTFGHACTIYCEPGLIK